MHLNKLNPSNGALLGRVAIGASVPGAGSNYGYSETSAPICANHHVIAGAAGSEYGIRGYVMAWTTALRPAWANPVWTIPPRQQSWRSQSSIVGGGAVWTPVTVDSATNTLYFGTGSATPLYFPSIRPGTDPRTDSLIAVDLRTGQIKWWRQLIAGNQWSYDVAQPPLVYDGKVGGHLHHVVSVATMEGVWFAFDANTGAPFYERVKVIDRVEHPALEPGKPVTVFPSSIGGLNYSPASFDPATDYVFNAAAETAGVDIQAKLTPTQKKHKFVLGSVFLGLTNGNFGTELAGWHDHGSISAIDVNTGRRVWKFETPEPERGGVTTTASGLGFAGGGDGNLRAFSAKTGQVLWKFQTGHQIAAGATIFSAGGKEYIAITVGGTPTSSNGGVASQLQVFTLGGSKKESPPPFDRRLQSAQPASSPKVVLAGRQQATTGRALVAASGGAKIITQAPLPVAIWSVDRANTQIVSGRLLLGGKPVVGAAMQVDNYTIQNRTNARGQFFYRIDTTIPRRHIVRVQRLSGAKVGGAALSAAQRASLLRVAGGFSVGYRVSDLATHASGGNEIVTGRLSYGDGSAPPPVVLHTYQLSGQITDAGGKPVAGATVVTRTQDRDFWTFSQPSDSTGHYVSFFTASDETGARPRAANGAGRIGQRLLCVCVRQERELRRVAQRDDEREAARVAGCAARAAVRDLLPGRDLRGHAGRRLRPRWRDQADLGDLARQERSLHARAAGLGAGEGPARLGGLLDVLPERHCHSRRPDRHGSLAEHPAGDRAARARRRPRLVRGLRARASHRGPPRRGRWRCGAPRSGRRCRRSAPRRRGRPGAL